MHSLIGFEGFADRRDQLIETLKVMSLGTSKPAAIGRMYSAQPAIMAEMFPTRMRYSGVSLGYQVTAIVAGSWATCLS